MLNKRIIFILFLVIIGIGTLTSVSANNITEHTIIKNSHSKTEIKDDINDLNTNTIKTTNTETINDLNTKDITKSTNTKSKEKLNETNIDKTSAKITIPQTPDNTYDDKIKENNTKIKSNNINQKDNNPQNILSSDDGTFTTLQNKIDNAPEESTITLYNDYYYNDDFKHMNYGIEITKSITINGNGHKIDGLSKSNLIHSNNAKKIILNNIIFQNGYWNNEYESPGNFYIDYFEVNSCQFINNRGTLFGGAFTLCFVNSSSFFNCTFENNVATIGAGGAIYLQNVSTASFDSCKFMGNLAFVGGSIYSSFSGNYSFNSCHFKSNFADKGGALCLEGIDTLQVNSCNFTSNYANGIGGNLYLHIISDSTISSCKFYDNVASYGGAIYCDECNMNIKDSKINVSYVYGYGGVIDSIYSNITINNTNFNNYISSADAGGAIYNVKCNLDIINSSFITGFAKKSGGAIASLKSNLSVLSCKFIDNYVNGYGGAIYNIYGNIYVNDSFFNRPSAIEGTAIYTEIPNSSIFTNNIFLNSISGSGTTISIVNSDNFIENGNHYEDKYHIFIEYVGYLDGEKFTVKSNILSYILSNTGTFLNTYEKTDFTKDYNDLVSLEFWDQDYPHNSTIFKNYQDTLTPKYNFTKSYYFNNEYMEYLTYYVYNDAGEIVICTPKKDIQNLLELTNTSKVNLMWKMISNSYSEEKIFTSISFPLMNSSSSDLTYIPQKYDSRDYGYITPIKDQAEGGNCWAFSGIATLEACIKKITNITYDFSEENAKNLMATYSSLGLNMATNKGGYDSMLMSYLNSWLGPIDDTIENYHDTSLLSSYYQTGFPIQNIYFLPARKSASDNDLYKKAIMDYGAISITFKWPGSGYHAVSIVGWDDNYNNYDSLGTYTKGAWIFKNSWGTDWGDNGFGYISYNTQFTSDKYDFYHAYTFIFNKNDSYIRNYQLEQAGVTDYLYSEGPVYYSNKFTSDGIMEFLTAFSTYFKYPTNYIVSVYKNNNLVLTQNGYSDAGYYTIPFNEKIKLDKYEEFSIVIKNCNDGDNVFPICQSEELNNVNFEANTSFFSYDGKNWFDLYDLKDYHEFLYGGTKSNTCQVACIKAFTSTYDSYNLTLDINKFNNINPNEKIKINITLIDPKTYHFDAIEMIKNSLISVNINGKDYYTLINDDGSACLNISFDKAGLYTLTAQYKNNFFTSNTIQFNFKVNKKDSEIQTTNPQKTNNENTKPTTITPTTKTKTTKQKTKIIANTKTYKKTTKTKKYTITLKTTNGQSVQKQKVTLKIKRKTYKATTNKQGKATFKIKLNKKGTYTTTIKYIGNNKYQATTKKTKIKIK